MPLKRVWYKVKYKDLKQDAQALLTIRFELVPRVPVTPAGIQTTLPATQTVRSTATSRGKTAAAHRAEIAALVGDSSVLISAEHLCRDQTCPNNPKVCVVNRRYGHLPVGGKTIRDWCDLVSEGQATVEACPPNLVR